MSRGNLTQRQEAPDIQRNRSSEDDLQNWQGRAAPGLEGSIPSPRRGWESGSAETRLRGNATCALHVGIDAGLERWLLSVFVRLSGRG